MFTSCSPRQRWITAIALLASLTTINRSFAAVTVQTVDGREIVGEVDEQTDDQLLWIRQQRDQILLTTSVAWTSIQSVTEGDQLLPSEQLPELLQAKTTVEPPGFLAQQTIYYEQVDCEHGCLPTLPKSRKSQRLAKIKSLDISAVLVNLDRDVEPDGIELTIAALDERGIPVPVKGSLRVRLWGERIQPHGSLVRYEDLEQWSHPVKTLDFSEGLAFYAFRFRQTRPEFDWGLHADGQVHALLSVRGQGNFAASVPVQIREFNPVRDRLQLTRGSRFFPGELTEEMRYQLPYRTHTRQLRTR